jgi:hypothetical protein
MLLFHGKDTEYDNEETAEIKERSSGNITIEQECSTDIMYLSSHLRAVIEGSTIDKITNNDILYVKISSICKNIKLYLNGLQNIDENSEIPENSSSDVEKQHKNDLKITEIIEIPDISKRTTPFSFSNPEINLIPVKPDNKQEFSLSSEWQIESEILENGDHSKVKWNSMSVISQHSASISNTSESSESLELLHRPIPKSTQTEFKKKPCWKKLFCCKCY